MNCFVQAYSSCKAYKLIINLIFFVLIFISLHHNLYELYNGRLFVMTVFSLFNKQIFESRQICYNTDICYAKYNLFSCACANVLRIFQFVFKFNRASKFKRVQHSKLFRALFTRVALLSVMFSSCAATAFKPQGVEYTLGIFCIYK